MAAVLPILVCQMREKGSPYLFRKTRSMLCWPANSMASLLSKTPVVMRMLWTLCAETANCLEPAWTEKRSPDLRRLAPNVLMTSCIAESWGSKKSEDHHSLGVYGCPEVHFFFGN